MHEYALRCGGYANCLFGGYRTPDNAEGPVPHPPYSPVGP